MQRLDLDRCLAHPWVSTSAGSLSKVLNEVRRPALKRRFFSGRSGYVRLFQQSHSPAAPQIQIRHLMNYMLQIPTSKRGLGDRQAPPEEREEPFQLPGDPSKDRAPYSQCRACAESLVRSERSKSMAFAVISSTGSINGVVATRSRSSASQPK